MKGRIPPSPLPDPEADWAWFLDLDGTLIDHAPPSHATVIPDGLIDTLRSLRATARGALVLVSDRPAQQVHDLLNPLHPAVAGLFGLEMVTPDGISHAPSVPLPPVGDLRNRLEETLDALPGVMLKNQGPLLTIHFDGRPDIEVELERIVAETLAEYRDFLAVKGYLRLDIHPAHIDKGTAVRAFMSTPLFAGRRPFYAGDDQSDESAFAVVNDMGGIAVRVGTAGTNRPGWSIDDSAALRRWLADAAFHLGKRRPDG